METLKYYLTCDFTGDDAVDTYYLQVVKFDSVVWAGMYSNGTLMEDYTYDGIAVIDDLRRGDEDRFMDMVDNTIYGEWRDVYSEEMTVDEEAPANIIEAKETAARETIAGDTISDLDEFLA